MAYAVTQRSREIGIRIALGAQPDKLRLRIVGEGLQLAACGVASGLIASFELTRFLSGTLYGVYAPPIP